MKILVTLALTLVLTAACLVGCGCTNQKMDNTSAPTVLPTNEEIWNSTETTARSTMETTAITETTGETTAAESTDTTKSINETDVQNHVNAHTDMMDKIRSKDKATSPSQGNPENRSSRMVPGAR